MKMSNYTISIEVGNRQTRTENIKGYIYKKDGLIFGIDHRYKDHWQITEINTGRSIGCGIPRLKDADTVLTDEMVEKVKEDNDIHYWDYPLDEYVYLAENDIDAVPVRFKDGDGYDYRFCEYLKEEE